MMIDVKCDDRLVEVVMTLSMMMMMMMRFLIQSQRV